VTPKALNAWITEKATWTYTVLWSLVATTLLCISSQNRSSASRSRTSVRNSGERVWTAHETVSFESSIATKNIGPILHDRRPICFPPYSYRFVRWYAETD
jgi:hypothetical protein